ncbi:MAG: hypothetical protein ACLTD2_05230 [Ruminococcus sp.]
MGIEIKLDMQAIKAIEDAAVKSAEVAMEQVRADLVSAQTMPFDTGDMQNNQTFVHADESGASLVTGSPQARRLYYHPEYHFQKDNNPNAGAAWLEPYITGSKKGPCQERVCGRVQKEDRRMTLQHSGYAERYP